MQLLRFCLFCRNNTETKNECCAMCGLGKPHPEEVNPYEERQFRNLQKLYFEKKPAEALKVLQRG